MPDITTKPLVATRADRARATKGAKSSNTAPAICTEVPSVQILRCAVDSLYLSYPGTLSAEIGEALDRLKAMAQSDSEHESACAQYEAGGQLFRVLDHGRHPYRYVLKNGAFAISVKGPSAKLASLAHTQIASEALAMLGPKHIEEELSSIIDTLGSVSTKPKVSRIDLCVDFVTDCPLHDIQDRDWVSRANYIQRYSDRRAFTGFAIGKGKLSARLYDKTQEIEAQSQKLHLYDLWSLGDWQGERPVWRLEFQFRRELLTELGLSFFPQVIERLGALWRYASHEWLRLAIPSETDRTQTRWPTHPLWVSLQAVDWDTPTEYARRALDTRTPPSDRSLFVNGLGGLTSYMAREGIKNPLDGIRQFWIRAQEYHDQSGEGFRAYVDKKVASKQRHFNTRKNTDPHHED